MDTMWTTSPVRGHDRRTSWINLLPTRPAQRVEWYLPEGATGPGPKPQVLASTATEAERRVPSGASLCAGPSDTGAVFARLHHVKTSRATADPLHRLGIAALDLLPVALLAIAASVRPARLPLLGLFVAAAAIAARLDRRRLPAWAAAIPVAVSLAWGLLPLPDDARDGSTCGSVVAPFATYRVGEALLALGAVAVLGRWLGGGGEELGLRRPGRPSLVLGVAAFVICGPLGILLGPAFAAPFFGPVDMAIGDLGAIVPALTFAVANGVMEEVIYRGSLRAWTSRVTGPWPAIVGQAIVFGVAHSGPDFTGSALPVAIAMFAGGLVAALIVRRTGSLFIPIMVHVGLDIPLYYGNACRVVEKAL